MSLNDLVARVTADGHDAADRVAENHVLLQKSARALAGTPAAQLDAVLALLDPGQHTLAFAHVLHAKLRAPGAPTVPFDAQLKRLIAVGVGSQLRAAGAEFAACVRAWCDFLLGGSTTTAAPAAASGGAVGGAAAAASNDQQGGNNAAAAAAAAAAGAAVAEQSAQTGSAGAEARPLALLGALRPLERALAKAKPRAEALTAVHVELLRVALRAQAYHVALRVVRVPVLDVAAEGGLCAPRDVLLYFYYAGLVHCGLKDWKAALRAFKRCVTSPVQMLSQITAEAYKKMMLVSLLEHGRFDPDLPRFTSNAVLRAQKHAFPEYQELCSAYLTRATDDLHKVADQHAAVWIQDKNLGLVKQVAKSLYRGNIRRNTQTYLTMSLPELATSSNLSSDEAQAELLDMIDSGEIHATINQKDGTVAFLERPQKFDDQDAVRLLHERIGAAVTQAERVGKLRDTIEASQAYAQRKVQAERGGAGGSGGGGGGGGGGHGSSGKFDGDDDELQHAMMLSAAGAFDD